MKRNDWILATTVLLYSYLFFHQTAGINFLILSIALMFCLLLQDRTLIRNLNWTFVAAGSLLSGFFVAWYSSNLAITSNIVSLSLLSILSVRKKSSVVFSLFFAFYSYSSSIAYLILDSIEKKRKKITAGEQSRFSSKLMIYGIPIFIVLIFFFIYQASNPLFNNFTKKINLDFISFSWIMFTLGGFLLLYGFFYPRCIDYFADMDEKAPLTLSNNCQDKTLFGKPVNLLNQNLSGTILLVLLNFLLLLVNAIDFNFIFVDTHLPSGLTYSEFVHQGIGMLILSILIAIGIILFYFRGELNFYKKNRFLKLLGYLWIIQNCLMIFSSVFRNQLYINEYSLTYKRIGVFVYLLLAFFGLATTFIKIARAKSNWYLFRKNAWLFYAVLTGACFVDWDVQITKFNMSESKKLDKYYLLSLSNDNLPQLLNWNESLDKKQEANEQSFSDFLSMDYYRNTYADFYQQLHLKLYRFLDRYQQYQWQSINWQDKKTFQSIFQLQQEKKITRIYLQQSNLTSLLPIQDFNHLQELQFANNRLEDLRELSHFVSLEKMDLSTNQIDSLEALPRMNKLIELNLSGNRFKNLAPLSNTPNLELLDLLNANLKELKSLPSLSLLKTLTISDNSISDFSALHQLKSLKTLDLRNTFRGVLDTMPAIPSLEKLLISSNGLGPNNMPAFSEKIRVLSNLIELDLSGNSLENVYGLTNLYRQSQYLNLWTLDKTKGSLAPLFPNLVTLNLSSNHLKSIDGIESCSNLQSLDLSRNEIKDLGSLALLKNLKTLNLQETVIEKIQALGNMTQLVDLNLGNCQLNRMMEPLASLVHLQRLDISGNTGFKFQTLIGLTSLQYLNLSNCQLEDIHGIEKLTQLEYLYLSNNSITDFRSLLSLKQLKAIYIDKIGKEQLEELKKALPDCTIYSANETELPTTESVR